MLVWDFGAGWSSQVARRAHNPKVTGSNPVPATNDFKDLHRFGVGPFSSVGYFWALFFR
jgi:hypothetical protein